MCCRDGACSVRCAPIVLRMSTDKRQDQGPALRVRVVVMHRVGSVREDAAFFRKGRIADERKMAVVSAAMQAEYRGRCSLRRRMISVGANVGANCVRPYGRE